MSGTRGGGSTIDLAALAAAQAIKWTGRSQVTSPADGQFHFGDNADTSYFNLWAEAANTLALRNGVNGQRFDVYRTESGSLVNYERLALISTNATLEIAAQSAGTGVFRAIDFSASSFGFWTGASYAAVAQRWTITSDGHLITAEDNVKDIGALGVNRPRDVHFGRNLYLGGIANISSTLTVAGIGANAFNMSSAAFNINGSTGDVEMYFGAKFKFGSTQSYITSPADGRIAFFNAAGTAGSAIELLERTAPSAPAANNAYLYAEDNGSGKTRLVALFPSGAAQVIATEP